MRRNEGLWTSREAALVLVLDRHIVFRPARGVADHRARIGGYHRRCRREERLERQSVERDHRDDRATPYPLRQARMHVEGLRWPLKDRQSDQGPIPPFPKGIFFVCLSCHQRGNSKASSIKGYQNCAAERMDAETSEIPQPLQRMLNRIGMV